MEYKDIKAELEEVSPGWNEPSFLFKDPACLPRDDLLFLCMVESQHALLQGRIDIARLSEPSSAKEIALTAIKRASVEGGRDLCNRFDIVALGNLKKLISKRTTMVAVLNFFYNLKQIDLEKLELEMAKQLMHDAWSSLSKDEVLLEKINPLLPSKSQQMLTSKMGACYLSRLLCGYYQTLYKCKKELLACIGDRHVIESWTTILWSTRSDILGKTIFKDYVVCLADLYDKHQFADLFRKAYIIALSDFLDANLHTRNGSYLEVPLLPTSCELENQLCTSLLDTIPTAEAYMQQSKHCLNQKFQCFTWHWSTTNTNIDLWSKQKFDAAYECGSMFQAIEGYKNVMNILERMECFDIMPKFNENMAIEEYLGREAASLIYIEHFLSMHGPFSDDYKLPYYVPRGARLTKDQIKKHGPKSLAVKAFVRQARPNFFPSRKPKGRIPELRFKGLPSKYFK